MLMVESQDTDKCVCNHMIKSHKVIINSHNFKKYKSKCRYCKCKKLVIA